jgi:hypothetical protein
MQIIVHLPDSEAYREIECEEENIRAAYREIVRQLENIMTARQIRYTGIEIGFSED